MTITRVPQYLKTNDGVELFVKDYGSGPAVIFTHGWPLSADMWDYHALLLREAGYRTIAFDKRGFGRSDQPDGDYSFDILADDLAAVVDASGADQVILVGYSMGGGEIIRYLSRHGSDKVAKIVLVATIVPGLLKGKDNLDGIDASMFDGIQAGLKADRATFIPNVIKDVVYDAQGRNTVPVTQEILDWSVHMSQQASYQALLACVDTFGRTDLRAETSGVKVPTLILHGTNDKPVPADITAKDAAARIAGSRLVLYEGASHGIVVTERDKVASDLLEFVNA